MDNTQIYELLGFVKVSAYRTATLKSINNDLKMPSQIAKEINVNTSQVSSALSDLKKKNLVICINENVRKGRLYKCTDLGKSVAKKL